MTTTGELHATLEDTVRPAPKCWLLTSADRPDDVAAALASDAGAVVLDLGSSVPVSRKGSARELVGEVLSRPASGSQQRWVRINPLGSDSYGDDIACLQELELDGIVLAGAQSGTEVARLTADTLESGWTIHATVSETPASLFQLDSFSDCSRALTVMSWGVDDLSTALGASSKFDEDGALSFTYRMARSLSLAAARAAGVQPVDCLFRDIDDSDRLRREAEAARRDGFEGKLAIHASQVAVINAAFTPSEEEVTTAQSVVDAFEADPESGLHNVRGRLVDTARLTQARRVIERSRDPR